MKKHIMKLSTSLLLHMERRIRWGRTPRCIQFRFHVYLNDYNQVHLGRDLNLLSYETIIVSDRHFIAENSKKSISNNTLTYIERHAELIWNHSSMERIFHNDKHHFIVKIRRFQSFGQCQATLLPPNQRIRKNT